MGVGGSKKASYELGEEKVYRSSLKNVIVIVILDYSRMGKCRSWTRPII